MEGKDSFILYTKYINIFKILTDEQAGMLIKHILNYTNDLLTEEQEDELADPVVKMAWINIKIDLKEDLVKWKNICETNRINGLKGGRPKKQTENPKTEKTERLFQKPKKADNDNEYDNEYENNNVSTSKDIDTCGEVSQEKPTPLIILPCIGNYQHPIFKDDIDHYKELYPAVDILQQFKNMLGWLESKPQNRKTKNGVKSFITRWLSKCQDKAPKVEAKIEHQEYAENPPFRIAFESDEEYNQRLRAAGWQLKNGVPAKLNGGYEEL